MADAAIFKAAPEADRETVDLGTCLNQNARWELWRRNTYYSDQYESDAVADERLCERLGSSGPGEIRCDGRGG